MYGLSIGGAYKWQSVKSAARALLLVLKSATPTEDLTEHGRLMWDPLEQLLTAHLRRCTFAQAASEH